MFYLYLGYIPGLIKTDWRRLMCCHLGNGVLSDHQTHALWLRLNVLAVLTLTFCSGAFWSVLEYSGTFWHPREESDFPRGSVPLENTYNMLLFATRTSALRLIHTYLILDPVWLGHYIICLGLREEGWFFLIAIAYLDIIIIITVINSHLKKTFIQLIFSAYGE